MPTRTAVSFPLIVPDPPKPRPGRPPGIPDFTCAAIATLSERLEELLAPFAETLEHRDAIPGINRRTAEVLIAELGVDMTVFSTAAHVASWADLCPGNN